VLYNLYQADIFYFRIIGICSDMVCLHSQQYRTSTLISMQGREEKQGSVATGIGCMCIALPSLCDWGKRAKPTMRQLKRQRVYPTYIIDTVNNSTIKYSRVALII
jgi:hypothetical protein